MQAEEQLSEDDVQCQGDQRPPPMIADAIPRERP
jgi:hypothetical protein